MDEDELVPTLVGCATPATGVTLTKEENAKLRRELQEKEARKARHPFGFRLPTAAEPQ